MLIPPPPGEEALLADAFLPMDPNLPSTLFHLFMSFEPFRCWPAPAGANPEEEEGVVPGDMAPGEMAPGVPKGPGVPIPMPMPMPILMPAALLLLC